MNTFFTAPLLRSLLWAMGHYARTSSPGPMPAFITAPRPRGKNGRHTRRHESCDRQLAEMRRLCNYERRFLLRARLDGKTDAMRVGGNDMKTQRGGGMFGRAAFGALATIYL